MELDYNLLSEDELTQLVRRSGINSWNELTDCIKNLPYGRNKNRTDLGLVISEQKGSCSSKHALLKQIADLNHIPNVELILGMYRMTELNTPKIGNLLTTNEIEYIPEAHCYLKIDGNRVDLTAKESEFKKIELDILEERSIRPDQVAAYKIQYHQAFIKSWLPKSKIEMSFDQVWQIREKCIQNLTSTPL